MVEQTPSGDPMQEPRPAPYDPGDAWVVERITTYWSENRRSAYRRMRREKTWDSFVESVVERVREVALGHISRGELNRHAWRRAIRTEVMGLEED